jgi:hypothetical protein
MHHMQYDEDLGFGEDALSGAEGAWTKKRVYESFRLNEKPVLGVPCVADLNSAPIARVLRPMDEDTVLWSGFVQSTLVLLLKGGLGALLPWARGERLAGPVRTRLDRWRGTDLDGSLYADNPHDNAQNRRYEALQLAILRQESSLTQVWSEAAAAVSAAAPSNREELVGALAPWVGTGEGFPPRMMWGLCIKNARAYLEEK